MKRLLCLMLSLLLLAGCGAKEKEPYVATGNGLSSEKPKPPEGSQVTAQSLSLALFPDRSLSPFQCTDITNRVIFSLVYQGLFAVDSDYQAHPVLCSRYTVSRDMKTYTFYLEEASFSDGEPVTAADVIASLKEASESAWFGGRFSNVEAYKTTDEGAVEITLTTPYENFQLLLDVPVVPKKQIDRERPVGSGPYIYEEFDGQLRLRRRSDWWCVAELPVTAQIITLVSGQTMSQLRDEFEFSGLGVVCADPGSESYVDFHSDYELWACETGVFLYLACNEDSKVLKPKLRKALTYGIHREALVEAYYRGFGKAAYLPASPDSPWYSTVLTKDLRYEPEKLTQAVTDSGAGEQAVVLLVNKDDGVRLRAARAIKNSLEQCGMKITMSELATQDYVKALEKGEYDLYLGQTKLSANMDLSAFFAPKGALSFGDMDDSVVYALCKEALANSGNYYTLYKQVLDEGMLCPILVRSCAIFVQRGMFTNLNAARDNVFYYDLGKDPAAARGEAQ
ncbi:MAG: ABC transporter substrate-binding protein [Oscillospiraceae bacterium]|nr:ABC transporter substrate-binding protein [Oscillospiraceae bacterium]